MKSHMKLARNLLQDNQETFALPCLTAWLQDGRVFNKSRSNAPSSHGSLLPDDDNKIKE
jgi:hypothetical protein